MPMDTAACRVALCAGAPNVPVRTVCRLGAGWDSTAFLVNEQLVVRFPRRPAVAATLRREARLLPQLAPLLPCAIPRFSFLAAAGGDGGLPFAGYPLVPGVPLEQVALSALARARLAADCGRLLSALHAFPVERARALGLAVSHISSGPAGWAAFRKRAESAARPHCDARERSALARWFDRAESDGITVFAPVLTHADLGDEHLLVEPASGALTGVIDWADAMLGDPAIDFAGLLGALGEDGADRALAHYTGAATAGLLARARIYAAAGPLHELIFAEETADREHLANGLARLRVMLAAA